MVAPAITAISMRVVFFDVARVMSLLVCFEFGFPVAIFFFLQGLATASKEVEEDHFFENSQEKNSIS